MRWHTDSTVKMMYVSVEEAGYRKRRRTRAVQNRFDVEMDKRHIACTKL